DVTVRLTPTVPRSGMTTSSPVVGVRFRSQLLAVCQVPPAALVQVIVAGSVRSSRASTRGRRGGFGRARRPRRLARGGGGASFRTNSRNQAGIMAWLPRSGGGRPAAGGRTPGVPARAQHGRTAGTSAGGKRGALARQAERLRRPRTGRRARGVTGGGPP